MTTYVESFNEGYDDYCNGEDFDSTKSKEWQSGWNAAQADCQSCEDEAMERDAEAYMEMRLSGEEP